MTDPIDNELETELRELERTKHGSYDKRTEHLREDGVALFINRLVREDSPYLLQHAHNPVNWFSWGAEAFAQAKTQNKPVFLSIGYSTCHWCHVMEVESFDNIEVAEVLNRDFICIKMDREQYPDIDEIYMTGVQLVSGQGGWPMSSFLLADGKPFFAATYFPAASFISLLNQIAQAWKKKYDELESSAHQIAEAIDRILSDRKQASSLQKDIVENTIEAVFQREDRRFGGLSGEPKFPQEPLLLLLLDHIRRQRDVRSMAFVDRALEGMARGGIYDQIAGGFHRYSVDAQWLVPHFEKMLYNQSQLGLAYLEAYELSGKPLFRRITQQILNYVARDMQLPEGGFYSATDADSEGEEGAFFTWTIDQLKQALQPADFEFISRLFSLSEFGNFEGSNSLSLARPLEEFAEESGDADFYLNLDRILQVLYQCRENRIHPLRDDKLIVAWTAAMMTTFIKAACTFDSDAYLLIAERAAHFVWKTNVDDNGMLKRIYLDGAVSIAGQLEDYANFSQALICLFDVTDKIKYLEQASNLMSVAMKEFWNLEHGGFFLGPKQQTGPQLTRSRNASDAASLSPVATAFGCLLSLKRRNARLSEAKETGDLVYGEKLDQGIAALLGDVNDKPLSHSSMLKVMIDSGQGSRDCVQWINGGRAKLGCRRRPVDSSNQLGIEIDIALMPDWHISASNQTADTVYPLEVSLAATENHWNLDSCSLPPPSGELTVTDTGSIAIYENSLKIQLNLKRSSLPADSLSHSVQLQIKLQLCSKESCLLPQTAIFRA